jgi:predicted enzyme related to lactoylglutathione lyase
MNIRYAHTNIIASDWKKLAAFYQEVFECVMVPPERNLSGQWLEEGTGVKNAALRGVHLRLPGYGTFGPTLEIFEYHHMEEKPVPAANRKGLMHLAFEVSDVLAIAKKVLQHGGKMMGKVVSKPVPGVGILSFVYVCDPEDNIIEIQHWSHS